MQLISLFAQRATKNPVDEDKHKMSLYYCTIAIQFMRVCVI